MPVKITKISDNVQKSAVTDRILRSLPEWFGIEEAIADYADGVKSSDFYAAFMQDEPVGLISIKSNNPYTSEIYVTAVLKEHHHWGIGRKLLESAEQELINSKVKLLMVKTLGESDPDENYAKTRKFYLNRGFIPLQEIKEIWGESNPCLVMVKDLRRGPEHSV